VQPPGLFIDATQQVLDAADPAHGVLLHGSSGQVCCLLSSFASVVTAQQCFQRGILVCKLAYCLCITDI